MHDCVYFSGHEDEVGYVMADKQKIAVPGKVGDIIRTAGDEIVHADDAVTFLNQTVAKVRTKETSSSSNEYAHKIDTILLKKLLPINSTD